MAKVRVKAAGDALTIGLAQVAPVWLNREKTLSKVTQQVEQAAAEGCQLVAFGEALVPGGETELRPIRSLRPTGCHPTHRLSG